MVHGEGGKSAVVYIRFPFFPSKPDREGRAWLSSYRKSMHFLHFFKEPPLSSGAASETVAIIKSYARLSPEHRRRNTAKNTVENAAGVSTFNKRVM
jgi:hypothetical protein